MTSSQAIQVGWSIGVSLVESVSSSTSIPRSVRCSHGKEREVHLTLFRQVECLSKNRDVALGLKNLVYFAPTSGGKSVVSEVLMLR